jgi:serine/threonine protein kinase
MAPEALRGAGATTRSDLYSVGVLLYHLVTGGYPVAGRSIEGLRLAHQRGQRTWLRDARPALPRDFVAVVERALEANPSERFASAGEMEQALAALLPEARPVGGAEATGAKPGPRRRRLFFGLAVAGAAVALALWLPVRSLRVLGAAPYTVHASLHRVTSDRTEILHAGSRVAPGDRLALEFRASRSLHVYVLNEDERGEAYLLFPLPGLTPTNPLAPDTSHLLPGHSSGRQAFWGVSSSGEREHFLVVASPERLVDFEAEALKLARPRTAAPMLAARLTPEAKMRLRGVGDLILEDLPPLGRDTTGTSSRLASLARQLADHPESVRGIWVRQIDVENPSE